MRSAADQARWLSLLSRQLENLSVMVQHNQTFGIGSEPAPYTPHPPGYSGTHIFKAHIDGLTLS